MASLSPGRREEFLRCHHGVNAALGLKVTVERRTVPRAKGKATALDVTAPLQRVLGDSNSPQDVESNLHRSVAILLHAMAS